ncbi:MAG TPA: Os1348 family NHLP clan protein [Candidatus Limnocylindria bacterium]|nr:Os1348 family NHLP clan protein [Candidatus Limnocylindria bacterium]
MSKEALAKVVQRAISDGAFRRQLSVNPTAALQGFDLSRDEAAAIRSGDSGRLSALGVDLRMSKAFALGDVTGDAHLAANSDLGSAYNSANAAVTGDGGTSVQGALVSDASADSNAALISDGSASLSAADVSDGGAAASRSDVGDAIARFEATQAPEGAGSVSKSDIGEAIARFEAANTPDDNTGGAGGGGVIAH